MNKGIVIATIALVLTGVLVYTMTKPVAISNAAVKQPTVPQPFSNVVTSGPTSVVTTQSGVKESISLPTNEPIGTTGPR